MSCRRLAVGLKLGRTRVVPEAVAECLRNACLDHFLCRRTPLRNPVRKRVARSHRHPLCFAIAIKGNLWGGIEQPELWIRLTPHRLAGGMTVTSCDTLPYEIPGHHDGRAPTPLSLVTSFSWPSRTRMVAGNTILVASPPGKRCARLALSCMHTRFYRLLA